MQMLDMAKVLGCLVMVSMIGIATPAQADTIGPNGDTFADGGPNGNGPLYSPGVWLFDSGSTANGSGRTVSGTGVAGGWEVFQPFEVPAPGWIVETIGTDGWLVQDPLGQGMLGRLHPDDGAGNPNEAVTLGSGVYYLGNDPWNPNWRDQPIAVTLDPGTYWMHWSDNGDPDHWSAIFQAPTGLNSFSRSGGSIYPSGPTALRVYGDVVPEPSSLALLCLGGLALVRRR